jgi:hypothetical protein
LACWASIDADGSVAALPESYPALLFMSQLQEDLGDLSKAADFAGRAYAVPGPRANTGVRYVELLARAGRTDEARRVVTLDPDLARNRKLAPLLEAP